MQKLKKAKEAIAVQQESFDRFTASFPVEEITTWQRLLDDWYRDPQNNPCPFFNPIKSNLFAAVGAYSEFAGDQSGNG